MTPGSHQAGYDARVLDLPNAMLGAGEMFDSQHLDKCLDEVLSAYLGRAGRWTISRKA